MNLEQFLKKNMKRISRLERELDKLFDGTYHHTAVEVQQDTYRSLGDEPQFTIGGYISQPCEWYYLENFANMSAMIAQIKHDVKEDRNELATERNDS